MQRFSEEKLFFLGPEGERLPFGSSTGCNPPVTASSVRCFADLNDQSLRTVERVQVECRGDTVCDRGSADRCCRVTAREKLSPAAVREPSREDKDRWDRERCGRLRSRRRTCGPYCTSPRWSGQCSDHWGYVDPSCRTVPSGD